MSFFHKILGATSVSQLRRVLSRRGTLVSETMLRMSRSISVILACLCAFSLVLSAIPAFAAPTINTTTTLASASNPVAVGSPTLLTASVTGSAPTGTVTFKSGNITLGTGTLSGAGNTRTATFSATFTTTGTKNLTAVYGADATNKTSTSATLSQTVSKANTTTSVTSGLNPSNSGNSVTFTATVVGYTPSGTITFKDGTTTLGTASLSGSGNTRTATYSTNALSVASHSITAVYAGNTLNNTSTSTILSQVVKTNTTTVLASSANPSNAGVGITLTATVSGASPSGSVTFKDGAATLGTATVSGGVATLATSALTAGSHSLTAVYAGDTLNNTSTSSVLTQTINAVASTTTTSLASSVNPSTLGQGITLTATVTGNSPSGTVTFKDGATTLGTGTVTGGVATLSTSVLAVGTHGVTAVYGGDAANLTSTSGALSQIVNKMTTATSLSSSLNPSTFGQGVTLTATVSGGSNPSGTVTFLDGATTLGTGTLSAGVATFNTSTLSVTSHSITAVYGGDANNATSTSSVLGQVVNKVATTTGLISSANPVVMGQSVTFTATVSGGNSPSGTVTFMDGATTMGTGALSGGVATYSTNALSVASHNITAVYGGDTNNATSTSTAVVQVVNPVASSISLSSSVNPAAYGQGLTLTATVTGNAPGGTVTFMDGAATLGAATLSNGAATFTTSTLSVASHSLTAVYGGDVNNAGSTSAALAQVVNQASSTITLSSSANPSIFGQSITLTASVTGNAPSGTVTFMDGATTLGTGTLSAGVATFSTSTLGVASHSITAVYSGDVNNAVSTSSALTQGVNAVTTTTALASSANPATFGQSVTLTATVTGNAPTGTVTFMDGAATLGTGTLSSGVATFNTSTLSVASHSITAVYGGDANNSTSTSSVVAQVVSVVVTTTNLASNANPATFGQGITLTASVSGNSPSGTVTFMDGATTLGTSSLIAGVATFSTNTLSTGTHNLSAVYAGDTHNATSTSGALSQVVNKVATVTSLSASANPATSGQSVTFTATVTGSAPTGTVTFMDGATTLGAATLNAGVATFSTSTLSVASHSITAVYGGDVDNSGSTSAALAQVVNVPGSSTVLSSSVNPVTFGQSITLTATVTGSAPTGTVTFKDGATTLGTGALDAAGAATFTTAALGAGTHNLTAVYGGDANNATSTSSALSQVVTQVSTASAVTASLNPSTYNAIVTFTATVTGNAPTGAVTFMDGAATLGTGTLSGTGNSRTATYATGTLSIGTHSITAVYAGDTNNATSTSSALSQVVNKANTTSAVSSTPNPSYANLNATFTATVTGQAPTGTVTFMEGATVLGTGTLAGTGNSRTATLAISTLSVGNHSITAVYGGDDNNNTSTSAAFTQYVYKHNLSSLVLSSSANPSAYSQNVTLTATLNGGNNPTGTVSFREGSTTLATVNLTGNVASFDISTLSVATHSLQVVYNGDAYNNTYSSNTISQVVNRYTTNTALTSSVSPSSAGQGVTLTATVSGVSPTGNVTFKEGATTLGVGTLSGGVTSLNYGAWAAGSHSLTAVYGGDANNATSTSAVVVQVVNTVSTTLNLSLSKTTVSLGENVTLTARVVGGYIPSGGVTFSSGAGALGTASINGGAATFSVSNLGVGSHSLSATYPGDTSNQASSSNSVSLTVNPRGGMSWQYGYDAMGRINTMVDPNGLASYIYYDSLGRPIQTQQPPNTGASTPTVIDFAYNQADGLTQVADPRNLATTYSPNGLGNVTSQSSPDTGSSQYTYDAKGNVLTSTDARGKTTTYVYDTLDRVTSITYPTGTATTLEYDGGTTPTPAEKGELTKMTDESGQTTYTHDALGRLTTKITTISGKTFTTSYGWGDAGSAMDKLTAITYPSGTRVNYSYDAQGYISGITVNPVNANGIGTSGSSVTLLSALSYNAENKITGWLWSDGKARTIAYDSNGMVAAYSLGDPLGTGSAAGNLRTVTRDAAGRITGYSHTNNGTAQTSLEQGFGYDNLNRLLNASLGGSSTQYSYDATGNRTSKAIAGTTYSNTVASTSNRLTQTQDVNGTATIQYDAAGHITNDGTNGFTYSDRGRMTSATNAGGTVSYLYNGLNQRVYKSGPTALVNTGVAYFLYDEQGQLLGEYDANGAPVYETVYLGNLPVGVLKQAGSAANSDIAVTVYNVHADHIATVRVITQQDQTIVWRWDTAEAFGGTAPDQNPSSLGAFVYNQRFPGQVFDSETGLFQNWNREYNARQGRYIQSDPIGLSGGINTFAYVGGNPLASVDPRGLQALPMPMPAPPPGTSTPGGSRSPGGYDHRTDRPYAANDPTFGGGSGGGGDDCDCEKLKTITTHQYTRWQKVLANPTYPLSMKGLVFAEYQLTKKLYESLCGPFTPPRVDPEPPAEDIHDFYGR